MHSPPVALVVYNRSIYDFVKCGRLLYYTLKLDIYPYKIILYAVYNKFRLDFIALCLICRSKSAPIQIELTTPGLFEAGATLPWLFQSN